MSSCLMLSRTLSIQRLIILDFVLVMSSARASTICTTTCRMPADGYNESSRLVFGRCQCRKMSLDITGHNAVSAVYESTCSCVTIHGGCCIAKHYKVRSSAKGLMRCIGEALRHSGDARSCEIVQSRTWGNVPVWFRGVLILVYHKPGSGCCRSRIFRVVPRMAIVEIIRRMGS